MDELIQRGAVTTDLVMGQVGSQYSAAFKSITVSAGDSSPKPTKPLASDDASFLISGQDGLDFSDDGESDGEDIGITEDAVPFAEIVPELPDEVPDVKLPDATSMSGLDGLRSLKVSSGNPVAPKPVEAAATELDPQVDDGGLVAEPAFGDDLLGRLGSIEYEPKITSKPSKNQEPKDFDDLRHSGLASENNQAKAIALQRLQQNKENRANGVPEFDYSAGSPFAGFKGRKLERPTAADKLPSDADGANPEGNSGAVNRSIEDAGGGQESFNTSLVRLLETMARSQLSSASRLDAIEQMIRRSIP